MRHAIDRLIRTLEDAPLSLAGFATTFFALIFVRLAVENTLGRFDERPFSYYFFEFSHTFLFFLCAFLILLPLVRFAGNVALRQAGNVLLFGFLVILLPPVIDTLIFHGSQYWSFYQFDSLAGLLRRFLTFFGDSPNIGITYGVRVEVAIVTLGLGLYAFFKSRRLLKTLGVALLAYAMLFILGTFPSWITFALLAFQKGLLAINGNDVAALFLTPESVFARNASDFRSVLNLKMSLVYGVLAVFLTGFTLFREYPRYFFALFKNTRFPQAVYHAGLLGLGFGFARLFAEADLPFDFFPLAAILVLLSAVESAWIASVIANDCADQRIDVLTNPDRPLIRETIPLPLYQTIGVLFFIASLLLAGVVGFPALLILLAYQAIAWLYSSPPLRLKRFPLIATVLAAWAGILVLVTGFLTASPSRDLSPLPLPLLFFLFAAYAVSLPLKDFKDIEGDRQDHVYTLPVLLGAERAKLLLASLVFLLFLASPTVLNIRALFPAAVFIGGTTFWVIEKSTERPASRLSYRRLPGIVLALVAVYGLYIAWNFL